jgi:hypothetical protein
VAIIMMASKGKRRRLSWLFSDKARITGGDGRYPDPVAYHSVHSVLKGVAKAVGAFTKKGVRTVLSLL